MTIQTFVSDKGTTAYKQKITGSPVGVFFLSGHRTGFESRKREVIADFCVRNNISYVHFTYFGWDQSYSDRVPELGEGFVQDWLGQALDLFDEVTSGPQIVVGSSMGGYLGLALAQARASRTKAFVGIAAGFGSALQEKILQNYQEHRVGSANEKGFIFEVNSDTSVPIKGKLEIDCPIRLIHSVSDEIVSYKNTTHIADAVNTDNVIIQLVKGVGHTDHRPEDIKWLEDTLSDLIGL